MWLHGRRRNTEGSAFHPSTITWLILQRLASRPGKATQLADVGGFLSSQGYACKAQHFVAASRQTSDNADPVCMAETPFRGETLLTLKTVDF